MPFRSRPACGRDLWHRGSRPNAFRHVATCPGTLGVSCDGKDRTRAYDKHLRPRSINSGMASLWVPSHVFGATTVRSGRVYGVQCRQGDHSGLVRAGILRGKVACIEAGLTGAQLPSGHFHQGAVVQLAALLVL